MPPDLELFFAQPAVPASTTAAAQTDRHRGAAAVGGGRGSIVRVSVSRGAKNGTGGGRVASSLSHEDKKARKNAGRARRDARGRDWTSASRCPPARSRRERRGARGVARDSSATDRGLSHRDRRAPVAASVSIASRRALRTRRRPLGRTAQLSSGNILASALGAVPAGNVPSGAARDGGLRGDLSADEGGGGGREAEGHLFCLVLEKRVR